MMEETQVHNILHLMEETISIHKKNQTNICLQYSVIFVHLTWNSKYLKNKDCKYHITMTLV